MLLLNLILYDTIYSISSTAPAGVKRSESWDLFWNLATISPVKPYPCTLWTAFTGLQMWTSRVPDNGSVRIQLSHLSRRQNDTRTEWNSLPRIAAMYRLTIRRKFTACKTAGRICPSSNIFIQSAFTESLLAHPERSAAPKSHKKGLLIKAYAPCIDNDHCLGTLRQPEGAGRLGPGQSRPDERRQLPGMAGRSGCR